MINNIISVATILLFLLIAIQSITFKKQGIESTGDPPIQQKYVGIGKLSLILTWILLIIQSYFFNLRLIQLPIYFDWTSLVIVVVGLLYVTCSFLTLGDANKVGLPSEKTNLRTNGIYRISRNPMYVGFLLLSVASCIIHH
jgi:protein-S-isoprenylcysteine O-methyltransferase Ste14